jgi:hypothetical protein
MNKKYYWIILAVVIVIFGVAAIWGSHYVITKNLTDSNNSNLVASPGCKSCARTSTPTSSLSEEQAIKQSHCLQTPNGGTGNITIADVAHYSEATSPITISGTANVFEGSFQVKLIDCDGNKVIKQENAQTQAGEVGVSNPYSITITYPSTYAGHYAYIEAYDLSAKDGSVQDTIQVPVLLK